MLHDTLKNFSIEGTGFESAIISRFVKGGMKEAVIHAVNNTIEPVIKGRLFNPDLPPYLEEAVNADTMDETEETDEPETAEFADEDTDVISLDETNRKG